MTRQFWAGIIPSQNPTMVRAATENEARRALRHILGIDKLPDGTRVMRA